MGLFSIFSKTLIGVDLGSSAIKVIKGKRSGKKFQIEELYSAPLPHGCITDRGIEDLQSVVSHLTTALEAMKLRKPKVATAVKGAGVLTKRIMMPKVPSKEIPQQVRWEAEQVFPTDMSNVVISHLLLGEGKNVPLAPPGTPGWDILLVGVQKDEVRNYRDVLKQAGAEVKVMDLDAFSSSDLLEDLLVTRKKDVVAMVDIGASGTRVSVRYKGNVVFLREFEIGGSAFSEAISTTLGLSFEDAEALKVNNSAEDPLPQEAQDALNASFQGWKSELQQCEDIFVTQSESQLISKWYLYGGASLTPGLREAMEDERFAEKVVFVDAKNMFSSNAKSVDAATLNAWALRFFTAAGLCLRTGK